MTDLKIFVPSIPFAFNSYREITGWDIENRDGTRLDGCLDTTPVPSLFDIIAHWDGDTYYGRVAKDEYITKDVLMARIYINNIIPIS